MNAYELEIIQATLVSQGNLIKQQADRIAELEKFNKAILKKGGYPYEKSKPVAWMSPDGKLSTTEGMLFHIPLFTTPQDQADRIGVLEANHEIQKNINEKALEYIDQLEQGLGASIDLNKAQATRTTPQTKPLSDEEILELTKDSTIFEYREFDDDMVRFARAIEERHKRNDYDHS